MVELNENSGWCSGAGRAESERVGGCRWCAGLRQAPTRRCGPDSYSSRLRIATHSMILALRPDTKHFLKYLKNSRICTAQREFEAL